MSANLAFRIVTGVAGLGALYLATHAIATFVGWQVMAGAEPLEAAAAEVDDDDEDDDEKAAKPGKKPIALNNKGGSGNAVLSSITKYNVFCPNCAPEVPEEAAATPPPAGAEATLEFPDAVPSQLPLALVATMEADASGISLATISQTEGGTGVYAEGEQVLDNIQLLTVSLGIVYLQTPTGVQYLQLSAEAPPPRPKVSQEKPTTPSDTKKKYKNEIDGASDAIKCSGMSCTVERKFVAQLLANPAMLATQGNARPYSRDGLSGFRLSRVRKGTLPRMLGLRTGDLITGINGQPLNSLDGAMKLYAKLRSASHLSVDMVRNKSGTRHE
ncbi:MAG: hypothetical protein K0V04_42685, partial [Deltaproteobacteria bacterium]|nr:hypothetical protein [Deltaproteobacteria bacterium]